MKPQDAYTPATYEVLLSAWDSSAAVADAHALHLSLAIAQSPCFFNCFGSDHTDGARQYLAQRVAALPQPSFDAPSVHPSWDRVFAAVKQLRNQRGDFEIELRLFMAALCGEEESGIRDYATQVKLDMSKWAEELRTSEPESSKETRTIRNRESGLWAFSNLVTSHFNDGGDTCFRQDTVWAASTLLDTCTQSLLVVGDQGVGKSSLLREIARWDRTHSAFRRFFLAPDIVKLEMMGQEVGSQGKTLLQECKWAADRGMELVFLFGESCHSSRRLMSDDMDIPCGDAKSALGLFVRALLPSLRAGVCRILASAETSQSRRYFSSNDTFHQFFAVYQVPPPPKDLLYSILIPAVDDLSARLGVYIPLESIDAAIRLGAQGEMQHPRSAVDILTSAARIAIESDPRRTHNWQQGLAEQRRRWIESRASTEDVESRIAECDRALEDLQDELKSIPATAEEQRRTLLEELGRTMDIAEIGRIERAIKVLDAGPIVSFEHVRRAAVRDHRRFDLEKRIVTLQERLLALINDPDANSVPVTLIVRDITLGSIFPQVDKPLVTAAIVGDQPAVVNFCSHLATALSAGFTRISASVDSDWAFGNSRRRGYVTEAIQQQPCHILLVTLDGDGDELPDALVQLLHQGRILDGDQPFLYCSQVIVLLFREGVDEAGFRQGHTTYIGADHSVLCIHDKASSVAGQEDVRPLLPRLAERARDQVGVMVTWTPDLHDYLEGEEVSRDRRRQIERSTMMKIASAVMLGETDVRLSMVNVGL